MFSLSLQFASVVFSSVYPSALLTDLRATINNSFVAGVD